MPRQRSALGILKGPRLTVAPDTTPILGRGAVKDTYNLIADGIRKLVGVLARMGGVSPEQLAKSLDLSRYWEASRRRFGGRDLSGGAGHGKGLLFGGSARWKFVTSRIDCYDEGMDIGRRIARFRKLKDWTQEELGQKLDVHKTVISRWELGRMAPRLDTLQKLAEVLGIELSELADQDRAPLPNGEAAVLYRDFEALAEEDRMVVRKVVDAMLTRQRLKNALGA